MQRIFFVLLFFALVVITYMALLPQINTRIYIKQILRTPPQELRNGTFCKACTDLRRANGGAVYTNMTVPSWPEVEKQSIEVLPGGQYKPKTCVSDSHIAIIVPYRNRETQLRTFLRHIHTFLRNQFLNYRIFVVEMAESITFNRGALFNVGFKEANKMDSFDCIILHDVDLLPEDSRNNYTCARMPRHLSVAIDKFRYRFRGRVVGFDCTSSWSSLPFNFANARVHRLPSTRLFGGAVAISARQFQAINGCSNMFYGWGGEDDDLYRRVTHKNMTVMRYPVEIGKYKMIRHSRDQPINKNAYSLLKSSRSRMASDGLNSIQYKVLRLEFLPLYTWVLVSINQTITT